MTEEVELPDWEPNPGLNVTNLANALELIRRTAYMHWYGDGFDPEQMYDISSMAAQALCGQPVIAPVSLTSDEWRTKIKEDWENVQKLFDDDLHEAIGYED